MIPPIASSANKSASPFASWKIDHAAIRVPDFETAVAWYSQKLDFQLQRSVPLAGLTFALLSTGSGLILELLAGPGAKNSAPDQGLHSSYQTAGWHHLGFRVTSVDETIDELKRRGVRIVTEPRDVIAMGLRVAFFADPWGNIFEVIHTLADYVRDGVN